MSVPLFIDINFLNPRGHNTSRLVNSVIYIYYNKLPLLKFRVLNDIINTLFRYIRIWEEKTKLYLMK